MRTAVRTAVVGALSLVLASPGVAQQARRFTVTPMVGTIRWDDASALANKEAGDDGQFDQGVITPTIGLTADYNFWGGAGLGVYFDAARPTTRGDYFPAAIFDYGTRVELNNVSQRVTVMMYGLQGSYTMTLGERFSPYVSAGIGAVTVDADAEQARENKTFTHNSFQLGGGIGWRVGSGAVRLDVRNYTFTGWDRNELNVVEPLYQNTQFPEANGNPPEAKKTVNNFRIGLGFSFVPQRGGTGSDDTPTQGQE